MKQRIKRLLNRLGYDLRGTRMTPRQLLRPELLRQVSFDDLICRRMYEADRPLTFVQIGAFDGEVQDPLRKYIAAEGWRGVMVEPQPRAAERLRALYGEGGDVRVLQAAVDAQAGSRVLYTVESADAPAWAGGVASFRKEVLLKHEALVPGLSGMIREVPVACVTFERVLGLLPGRELDLLQIDTEGADSAILALFPFDRTRPAIVHWETAHLTLREREGCLCLLAGHGYRFAYSGTQDMVAVQF